MDAIRRRAEELVGQDRGCCKRLWLARVQIWRSGLALTPRTDMKELHYRIKRETPIYIYIYIYMTLCILRNPDVA